MNTPSTCYLNYRGFYYEIDFDSAGDPTQILIYTDRGRRPELVNYWSLDVDLRCKIQDTIAFKMSHEQA